MGAFFLFDEAEAAVFMRRCLGGWAGSSPSLVDAELELEVAPGSADPEDPTCPAAFCSLRNSLTTFCSRFDAYACLLRGAYVPDPIDASKNASNVFCLLTPPGCVD